MLPSRILDILPRPLRKVLSSPHRAFYDALKRWRSEHAEARLYSHDGLGPDHVVLDLGGYRGDWSDAIFRRYRPTIHVIEPHPGYATAIAHRFEGNQKIRVHPLALASSSGKFVLGESGAGSSQFRKGTHSLICEKVEAEAFLRAQGITQIELVKMNIEGGEFDLLPHLAAKGVLPQIGKFVIQFHLLDKESPAVRDAIRNTLSATHREEWCYPFVWESWVRKASE